jgi:hypothetical protein
VLYPLDHLVLTDRIILELPDELWGWGILTINFLGPSPCCGLELLPSDHKVCLPVLYPLDHLVLTDRIILELPDGLRSKAYF